MVEFWITLKTCKSWFHVSSVRDFYIPDFSFICLFIIWHFEICFPVCLYSAPSVCALFAFIDHILVLKKVFLRKNLLWTNLALTLKLHSPLALMEREFQEKGSTFLITSSNSGSLDLEVCPLLFFISVNV